MVNPLIPYDFAGVIWYQGESNACQPQIYTEATRALVADWRRQFGRDFSFYWCQLANYQAKSVDPAHLIPVPQTSIEYFSQRLITATGRFSVRLRQRRWGYPEPDRLF